MTFLSTVWKLMQVESDLAGEKVWQAAISDARIIWNVS